MLPVHSISTWARISAPVLVLFGEYDWFETAAGHELIARIVNRNHPGRARYELVPKTDHHFMRFARAEDAVADSGGTVNDEPVVRSIRAWLQATVRVRGSAVAQGSLRR